MANQTERRRTEESKSRIKAQQKMLATYDKVMLDYRLFDRYYGHSDFHNYGYWTPETATQREASESLVRKLLSFLPEKSGNILDVACGMGASTRLLLEYYRPEDIVAINLSEAQLQRARRNAPGCTFLLMDATHLEFPDSAFDNLICVESAFDFHTREQFYSEAFRVLKSGGRLVTSDIVFARWAQKPPRTNFINAPNDLAPKLAEAGFKDIEVFDVTKECWQGFCNNLRRWPRQERAARRLSLWEFVFSSAYCFLYRKIGPTGIHSYVLTSAKKPEIEKAAE